MRLLILTCLLICPVMADPTKSASHSIEADGSYRPPGRPAPTPHVYAVAGKPLTLHWAASGAADEASIHVDRLTSSRRVPVSASSAKASERGWTWEWKPPLTRGPAHYEVQLTGQPSTTVRIETRSPHWIDASKTALSKMQWEAAGLTPQEMNALSRLGLKLTKARDHSKDAPAFLRMIPNGSSPGRRHIVWDETELDTIVWSPGVAAGDLRVRAPRWWISPEALETDQGLIRMLELFSELPNTP